MDNLVKMGRFLYVHPFADTETQGRRFPFPIWVVCANSLPNPALKDVVFKNKRGVLFRKLDFCDLHLGDEIFQVTWKKLIL